MISGSYREAMFNLGSYKGKCSIQNITTDKIYSMSQEIKYNNY